MPRSRPASNPLSYHRHSGQYYVTRHGKRIYLGSVRSVALDEYYQLCRGEEKSVRAPAPAEPAVLAAAPLPPPPPAMARATSMTAKELANRFMAAQQANWKDPEVTRQGYHNWLARFLGDHPRLLAEDLTVEMFAAWKMSLRKREYSPVSINHFLKSVRAMYAFGEEAGLVERIPKLKRIKNESLAMAAANSKGLYSADDIRVLLAKAKLPMRVMILLGLNCGFGPKDLQDLRWDHIGDDRITLPRSKTGVCQTYRLWPETRQALEGLRLAREALIARLAKRGRGRSDDGCVFMTKYWHPWNKDAVVEEFRKLCDKVGVTRRGFYRLRHCASTAMSLVAQPHVQRRFMRHSQLQQQVTYTHVPDEAVDAAVMKARGILLGQASASEGSGNSPAPAEVA